MQIQAVRLTRHGKQLVVDVQTQNGWIEVIRESDDGTKYLIAQTTTAAKVISSSSKQ